MIVNRIITSLLVFNLSLLSPLQLLASAADDAEAKSKQIIELSHKGARSLAESLFQFYILNGIHDSNKHNKTMNRLIKAVNDVHSSLASKAQDIDNVEFGIEEAIEIANDEWSSSQELSSRLREAMNAYRKALVDLKLSQYSVNAANVTADHARRSVADILKHFKESCARGFSAQFIVPNLPPVTIRPPDLNFGFNLTISSDGDAINTEMQTSVYGNPSFEIIFAGNDSAGAYGAALASLTYLGAYSLAVASGFAANSAAAYAIGGVYFIAIMAVVYAGVDAHQKSEAKQQATAVANSVYYKANAQDVAEYYKQVCEKEGAPLLQMANRVESGASVAEPTNEDKEFVEAAITKMQELNQVIAQARSKLEAEGHSGEILEEKLRDSKEFQAMTDYVKDELGFQGIVRALAVQLSTLIVESEKAVQLIQNNIKNDSGEHSMPNLLAKVKEMQERMKQAYIASYSHSMTPENTEVLVADFTDFEEAGKLYIRWQKLYGDYLFNQFYGQSNQKVLSDLAVLLADIDVALIMHSQSNGLKIIKNRLQSFLGANP